MQRIGVDISHWNKEFNPLFSEFQIHKVSEGRTFVDSLFDSWTFTRRYYARNGLYHVMGIGNNGEDELDNFIKTIESSWITNGICALDIEPKQASADYSNGWKCAKTFVSEFKNRFGIYPFLYTNTSWSYKIADDHTLRECPLWIASYNKTAPVYDKRFGKWKMWQFTNKPFDINISEFEWNDYVINFN